MTKLENGMLRFVLVLCLVWVSITVWAENAPRSAALQAIIQALQLEKEQTLDDETLVSQLNRTTVFLLQKGQYKPALLIAQTNQQHAENALGKEHPQTLGSVNNLAALYESQGRYAEAEPLYQRALQTSERALGKDNPDTLAGVNNLAGLYRSQGGYAEAEPLYQRALQASKRELGEAHPQTLISVNNLAALYDTQGHYAEAEPLYQRALQARERVLGKAHPDTLTSLNNLAGLYQSQGRYAEAKLLFQRTLQARERVLGKAHPQTLISVNNLAVLYGTQGRYVEAEPLLQRALQAREDALGKAHPDTLATRLNLVANLMNLNKAKQSLKQLQLYQSGLFELAGRELRQEADLRDKRQLLLEHSNFQDLAYSLALQHPSAQTGQFAATVLLRWHQVDAEEQLFLQRMLRHSGDPAIQALAEQLARQRQLFSAAVNQKSIQRDAFEALKQQLQTLEQSLAAKSQPFKQHLAIRQVHASDLQGALAANTGLLILRVFSPYNPKTGKWDKLHWLAAWLSNDENGEMRFRFYNLGPVEQSAALWLAAKQDGKASSALYTHLFSSLDESLAAVEKLYIVPDHFLHLADFGRWRLPNGDYWLQRQAIHRLNTARDLMRQSDNPQANDLIAFGGIAYDQPEVIATAKPDQLTGEALLAQRNLAKQNTDGFGPLPATDEEVGYFERTFWDPKDIGQLHIYRQQDASEKQIKQINMPPRILHLATHGFYLEDQLNVQRPMVLSGLALANANQGLQGNADSDGEDGILYALEAVGLNLEGTELVTLSACDTGKGVTDYSEGVYGLVQAFKLAGAKNVLMTLKKVKDSSARRFMRLFYSRWLNKPGQHPATALRQAKLDFINGKETVNQDPEFWSPMCWWKPRNEQNAAHRT